MRKALITLFVLIHSSIFAAGLTNSFEFLRTDFNPRTAGTAGAYLTMHNDVAAMFTNPAGLADLETESFNINYVNYLLDINGGTASYNRIYPEFGVLAVGIRYMDYGDFPGTNEFGELDGTTFGANDFALVVGVSNYLSEQFTYGVNLKYIHSKIENSTASAVALDFGLRWQVPFMSDLSMGFTLRNLGSNFEYYEKTKEYLPQSINVGISKILEHLPLEISLAFLDLNREAEEPWDILKRISLGGEFRMSEYVRLRLGYDYDLHEGLDSPTEEKFGGLSGGFGLFINKYRIDYAYSNMSILGSVHRFGINMVL